MYAEIADLEAALGRSVESSEIDKAQRALRSASNRAAKLAPWKVTAWGTSLPDEVRDAVGALAARRFNARSDGLISVGPFRYGDKVPLDFTDDELDALGLVRTSRSISIARPDPE
jgi:hypothetical protein